MAVRNNGPGPQLMDDWSLLSVVGTQIYTFPTSVTIRVSETVRIHSGPDAGDNPPGDLKWTGSYVWNNGGDEAELRDDQGAVRDSLCYGDACP